MTDRQNDTRLHWVLLPGLDGTGLLFEPLKAAIPTETPIAPVSYPTRTLYSYEALVSLVSAAVPTNVLYVLIAESFSGPIAIQVAATAQHRPSAVVLCASFAGCPFNALSRRLLRLCGGIVFRLRPPEAVVRHFLAGKDAPEDLVRLFYNALASVPARIIADRLKSVLAVNVISVLSQITVPLLYIRGSQDRLVGPACARLIQKHCAQVQVETIEAPHFILQRQPERCVSLIQRFIGELCHR